MPHLSLLAWARAHTDAELHAGLSSDPHVYPYHVLKGTFGGRGVSADTLPSMHRVVLDMYTRIYTSIAWIVGQSHREAILCNETSDMHMGGKA